MFFFIEGFPYSTMITPWIWIHSLKYYWTASDLERRNQYCQRMSAANTVIRVVMIVSTDVTLEIQISTLSYIPLWIRTHWFVVWWCQVAAQGQWQRCPLVTRDQEQPIMGGFAERPQVNTGAGPYPDLEHRYVDITLAIELLDVNRYFYY